MSGQQQRQHARQNKRHQPDWQQSAQHGAFLPALSGGAATDDHLGRRQHAAERPAGGLRAEHQRRPQPKQLRGAHLQHAKQRVGNVVAAGDERPQPADEGRCQW